ncbi:MAG: lipoyl(octanoyl) transferase LipB [Cytophagales bacterium]|nr:MAG: lipoyl(octanoyl) transferase LipB [Cytophagales bacterium]
MNTKINKSILFRHLGLISYAQAFEFQSEVFNTIVSTKITNRDLDPQLQVATSNYLIICEHPHVFTLGRSGKQANLLLNSLKLQEISAEFHQSNRGGDITYHGPGQMIAYPILDLDNFFTDIHQYMRFLEEIVIQTLANFGIIAGRIKGLTGVWLDYEHQHNPRKICAFGVKTSRWVTMHGLALNINTDLDYFNHIIPCGISDKSVTSIEKEIGKKINVNEVEEIFLQKFEEIFQATIEI